MICPGSRHRNENSEVHREPSARGVCILNGILVDRELDLDRARRAHRPAGSVWKEEGSIRYNQYTDQW